MAIFEILVNGESRYSGNDVTAVTLACERVGRRNAERVVLHVGTGGPGEREIHHLATNLAPGDEIVIRVLEDSELVETDSLASCSFCGSSAHDVHSLVAVQSQAICDACIASLSAFVLGKAELPFGAAIHDAEGAARCAFCDKAPPDVPAVLVRNESAICPGCLRSCSDLHPSQG